MTLEFFPDVTAEAFVYSKCPKLVSFIEKYGKGKSVSSFCSQYNHEAIRMYKGAQTLVSLKVKCWEEGVQTGIINLVDSEDQSIIKSWLIEVEGIPSTLQKIY